MRLAILTHASMTAAALLLGVSFAEAQPCRPARVGPGVDAQPEAFRQAVAALVLATATEGQPWSCSGGLILLETHERGATLTIVTDDGRSIAREVQTPDEIEPLGQALLARPLPSPAPPPSAPTPAAPPPSTLVAAGTLPEPRVLIDALVMPRYAGGSNAILGGIAAGARVPFGPWFAGAWVRYDALSAPLDERGGPLSEVSVGASAGRSFALRPLELRAAVTPSAAIVTRGMARDDDDDTRVDGRVGVDVRGVVPITSFVRAVVALDAEIAPRAFGKDPRPPREEDRFSRYPSYTFGLGVGVELAPR